MDDREIRNLSQKLAGQISVPRANLQAVIGRARQRRLRRYLTAGFVGLVVTVGVIVPLRELGTLTSSRVRTVATPPQVRVASVIRLPGGATDVATGFGSIWVPGSGRVDRIDAESDRIVATITIPGGSTLRSVAAGSSGIWLTDSGRGNVVRIDPATNKVAAIMRLPCPIGVAVSNQAIWVTSPCVTPSLYRIDPRLNKVVGRTDTGAGGPGPVTLGEGAVWVTNTSGVPSVVKVDPRDGRVIARLFPIRPVRFVATGLGSIWVATEDTVARVDPASGSVAKSFPIQTPSALDVARTGVWILSSPDASTPGYLFYIDAKTDRITKVGVRVGRVPIAVARVGNSLWVANEEDGSVTHLET